MDTRGIVSRKTALLVALAFVAVFALWSASRPAGDCTQWGAGTDVDYSLPASIGQHPISCQR